MVRPPRAPRASAYVRRRAATEPGEAARVKDLLAVHGLSPRKRFGQNFLIREETAERIVDHARLDPADVAVEIGPGAGALTFRLARRVRKLIAVELDRGLAAAMREEAAGFPGVDLIEGDFLELDLAALAAEHGAERLVVVGNIPYNITTPILERIFAQRSVVTRAVLLVQKEYAERLAAAAGTPEYGALTLFARYHARMEPLMRVTAASFWPRPDVDSMLVRFFLRDHPPVDVPDEALLFRVIRGSFHMRRKQLMNTLEETLALGKDAVARLARQAGIDPQRRGETLTLEEFARLARAAAERGSSEVRP
ncbi:MAG: ribosomal RNA small subunit methyltransferase A [Candidatus Eisenbacteria bacterium]|uniref:Ribosomal RNA small subunit methyltransferase A n=1 Tax=Eiseniibacteriota bacterium TaxID=2212470 RepID=A0A9D6LBU2_UNCEI|nr:ribosomal RNA small subunit methyltransferase A [Candidatus Eisenbacteria bacterium]MBI3539819.1 ribosomal RNA small subunit methyltransferase A [Candidatus Eisenbacteria bacterium]